MTNLYLPIIWLLLTTKLISNEEQKTWLTTCRLLDCKPTLRECINDGCLGKQSCKSCIQLTNVACTKCFDDILNEVDDFLGTGQSTIICDKSNELHLTVCEFFCRINFKTYWQCDVLNGIPLCNCNPTLQITSQTIPITNPTTTSSSTSQSTSQPTSSPNFSATSQLPSTTSTTTKSTTSSKEPSVIYPIIINEESTSNLRLLTFLNNGDIVTALDIYNQGFGFINVSSTSNGQLKYTLSDITNGTGTFSSVVALYNGKIASLSSWNGYHWSGKNVKIWDAGNGILAKEIPTDGDNQNWYNRQSMTVLSNIHNWNNLVINDCDGISIWDTETGQKIKQFSNNVYDFRDDLLMVPFFNEDLAIVGTHYDKTIRILNITSGVLKMKLNSTTYIDSMIVLSNDNLATGSKDYSNLENNWNEQALITIWNVADGKEKLVLRSNTLCTNLLVRLTDNRLASTCRYGNYQDSSNIIEIWNYYTGFLIKTITQEQITSMCAYYSTLFVGSHDGTVNFWNLETGKLVKTLRDHAGPINHLTILGGSQLIGTSDNKTIIVWNPSDGQIITKFTELPKETPFVATSLSNGDLAIGTIGGRIKIWNTIDRSLIRRIDAHEENVDSLITLSNGQLLSRSNNEIKIWNLIDGKMKLKIVDETVNNKKIIQINLLPNGDLITARKDGQIRVWNLNTGSLKNSFKIQTISCYNIYEQKNYTDTLKAISLLPNSDLVTLNECGDKHIYVSDSTNGQLKRVIEHGSDSFYLLTALSNGYLAVVTSYWTEVQLKILDPNNGFLKRAIPLRQGYPRNLLESQNDYLAISYDDKIQVWNVFEKSIDKIFRINSTFITNNGNLIASISADRSSIDIINVSDGSIYKTLIAHNDQINSIIFMPNGDLISASSDRTIKIWDLAQGMVKVNLFGHSKAVTSLLLMETGDLLSGGLDGIKIWDTKNWKLKKNLTDSEIHSNLLATIGNDLVAGGVGSELNAWNSTNGSIIKTFTYIDMYQYANLIGLTRSHKLVVTGPNYSCQTFLWDAKSDTINYISEINSPDSYTSYCISFFCNLRNGNLAIGFYDGLIEIWKFIQDGTCQLERRLAGHADSILSITELENGKLVSNSKDGNMIVWEF